MREAKLTGYVELTAEERDSLLGKLFSTLETIKDIIQLAAHPHRPSLIKNTKYFALCEVVPALQELDAMIGLKSVKEQVFEIVCHFLQEAAKKDLMHIVIYGPPGTGKTQLGHIIAKIFIALEVLPTDKFVVAKRSDFVGEFLGSTANKAQAFIDSIKGGCLFIDEVYSLGDRQQRDSFSKEAIDCLNASLLVTGPDQFLCIIAGYKEEVDKCFFATNKGLERRFPVRFDLSGGYTPQELEQIFLSKLKSFNCHLADTDGAVAKCFAKYKLRNAGGDVDNLVRKCKMYHSRRIVKTLLVNPSKIVISSQDVQNAFSELETKEDTFPSHLYL